VSGSSARYVYAFTDSQGRFTIENCIPGGYYLWAWRTGYYQSPTLEIGGSAAINDALLPCAPHGTPIGDWILDYASMTL
jgi:hypothetical protein